MIQDLPFFTSARNTSVCTPILVLCFYSILEFKGQTKLVAALCSFIRSGRVCLRPYTLVLHAQIDGPNEAINQSACLSVCPPVSLSFDHRLLYCITRPPVRSLASSKHKSVISLLPLAAATPTPSPSSTRSHPCSYGVAPSTLSLSLLLSEVTYRLT